MTMKLVVAFLAATVSCFSQSSGVGTIWTRVSGTLQSGATASGNGTALAVGGLSSASITINCSVACSGGTTINFEGSEDGTNFVAVKAIQLGTDTIAATVLNQGTTITGWALPLGGLVSLRARISAYSTGTITVTASATAAPYTPVVVNTNGIAGTAVLGHVIADSGSTTAATQATGTNLHAVLDTTSTTAVTQATGSNLHAVLDASSAVIGHTIIDTGSTTAVTGNPGVSQSGTWTVQPGNTANTTAWKVDNSAVTQPASIANGSDAATGTTTDARNSATDTTAVSVISVLKQISASVQSPPLVAQALRAPIPMALNVPLGQAALPVYESRPAPNFDPCQGPNKANVPVSTSSNVQLIAGVAGKQIRICGGLLVVTTAGSLSIVEGTGSVCATGIAAVIGSTTAANGPPLAATSGFVLGNGGATNAQAATPGNSICILLTGTGLIAGNIEYAY